MSVTLYTRRMPMLRLLLPFLFGIACQWYWPLPFSFLCGLSGALLVLLIITSRLSIIQRFSYQQAVGFLLHALLFIVGAIMAWQQDVRNNKAWISHQYQAGQVLQLTLQEPLVEKPNSYKARATINRIYTNGDNKPVAGQVLVYFKKDSVSRTLTYGSQLLTAVALQLVRSTGNPGAFDFQQYSLRQGITHQVYLTASDYQVLPQKEEAAITKALYKSREAIVSILQQYISGDKEAGLAEALLIGYKDDLDKNLVQSYANTGVVHVIAISGLHLGIIYWILLSLTRPLKRRSLLWLRFLVIVTGLWMFSLLAGAQPSVFRSAVMFTCLAFSTVIDRKGSMYNTLALSAFVLLCINPYWLWDVGFQLSYLAVLSIFLFFKPIYNWCYFPNKLLDSIWKLAAVSLAAQLLTLPISVYHFHQFPVLFLLSNLVAVPLSSLILIGEIILCTLAFIPSLATKLGLLLHYLIQWMNSYVERLDAVSFTVWKGLSITPVQTVLLYIGMAGIAVWLLNKQVKGLLMAVGSVLLFITIRSISFVQAGKQQHLIVYNVPKHQAIDILQGRSVSFLGDSTLLQNASLFNFHLQPSRIQHRTAQENRMHQKAFTIGTKQCLIIDTTVTFTPQPVKPVIDLLILSKSPKLYLEQLTQTFTIKQVIVDGSVPAWKADLWKRSAVALRLPFYDVQEKGAFVMPF
jgi:competence protein ComEC